MLVMWWSGVQGGRAGGVGGGAQAARRFHAASRRDLHHPRGEDPGRRTQGKHTLTGYINPLSDCMQLPISGTDVVQCNDYFDYECIFVNPYEFPACLFFQKVMTFT